MSAHHLALLKEGDNTIRSVIGTVVEQERLVDDRDRGAQVRQRPWKAGVQLFVRYIVTTAFSSLLHPCDGEGRTVQADEDQERPASTNAVRRSSACVKARRSISSDEAVEWTSRRARARRSALTYGSPRPWRYSSKNVVFPAPLGPARNIRTGWTASAAQTDASGSAALTFAVSLICFQPARTDDLATRPESWSRPLGFRRSCPDDPGPWCTAASPRRESGP